MRKPKAILADIDGTVIDHNERYDIRMIPLIRRLQVKRVRFSLATGRPHHGPVTHIIRELGITGVHIFNGGALIMDTTTEMVHWHKSISTESASRIIQYLRATRLLFGLEKKDCAYLSHKMETPYFMKGVPLEHLSKLAGVSDILKFVVFAFHNKLTETQAEHHIDALEDLCKDISPVKFKIAGSFGFDVTSEEATKHTAVLEYAKIAGVKPQEMIAIGNDSNDYLLFTACGYRIAMDDAPRELKEISDLVVPTTEKGGMRVALTHILSSFFS